MITDDVWMIYDDLKSTTVCQFKSSFPAIDPREVHVVMWQSRPAALDVRSRSVPAVNLPTVSTSAAAIVSVPLTAKLTASVLPIPTVPVPTTAKNHRFKAAAGFQQQLKDPSSAIFSGWPSVLAGAVRHKVSLNFMISFFSVCI